MKSVSIVGAGLAGCEAALQLVAHGFEVKLYDSKPKELLETYKLPYYAELVCNNSMGSVDLSTPLGLLLQELKSLGSILIPMAEKCRINDPVHFAVDKYAFSESVTKEMGVRGVKLINKHLSEIPQDKYVIVASGPLTDETLVENISASYDIEGYNFYDSSSPVVDIQTVNLSDKYIKKITNDLYAISIPMSIFESFRNELIRQSVHTVAHAVDKGINYENCQSIEHLAMKGVDELYFKRFNYDYFDTPCLLLRRESGLENGFILVGCMTTLRHSAQISVFSLIPSLEKCRLIKYGRMHRNTFFNVPKVLNEFFQIEGTNTFIIGQLSGIDGYTAAIASGLVAALKIIKGNQMPKIPQSTMIGGLSHYVSNMNITNFQPMCASFSLMDNVPNYAVSSRLAIESVLKQL